MPTKAVPTSPIPQYITVQELVDRANLPISSVRQWIREGRLRAYKVKGSRHVRILLSDVEALFEEIGG
ncbi:MAG: excisionase family DNA-binding protein [Mycobacterium sp.]|uniref:excisionase family DNA-binding protein n=1 Tax=Mycobacterium sp. TaxID=1785 RepID=UPI003F94FF33